MSDAADELGYDKPRKPWLRPLNDSVSLAELPTVSVSPGHNPTLVIGVEDLPARQRQVTFGLSLGGGNLGLVGGKGSGRTTALRTIAAAAVQTISVDALHVYALDYGAEGGLASLAGLPHVAAVINRSQPQRAARLLRRLREEVARRGALLSRSGYGTVADYRLAVTEGAPPFLLLLLDSWEGFTGSGIPVEVREAFTSLVNDGRAAGVQVVTTGGKALAAPTIASGYESIVSLRFDNLEDYKTVGVRVSALPDKIPPGRAYRLTSGTALQLGYVGRSSETIDQNEFIRELASQIEVGQQHPAHLRVDELPAEITLQAALNLYGPAEGHAHETIVGVGGDELALIRADLSLAQPAFVIAGPAKSGRTNALALLAQQMLAKGLKLCLLHTDSDGVIAEVASRPDVFDVAPTQKRPLLDQIQDAAVLIDDVHRFPDGDPWVSSLLERQGLPVIIAGDSSRMWSTWSGWPGMARQSGAGLLLNPRKSAEGEVIGVQLEEGDLGPSHAGRAWFGWRGQGTLVQIPLAERETAHSGDGNRSNRKVPTKASKRRSNSSR
jgi:S-DNA-T family DNA segregation ATPase FtsK/SpoIIIE